MKSSRSKARKITVQEDDDEDTTSPTTESLNPPDLEQEPALQPSFKSRKPFKQSSLRKSFHVDEQKEDPAEEDEDGGPGLNIRPGGTPGSIAKQAKKRASAGRSRLSFGPSQDVGADDDEDSMILGGDQPSISTPVKKPEKGSSKRKTKVNLPLHGLPLRSTDSDDDRPRYSKEYLSELQSSTPNTPQNITSTVDVVSSAEDEGMSLDPSELEGAMIVDTSTTSAPTTIRTEAEIQERKARRARARKEQEAKGGGEGDDYIALSDDNADRSLVNGGRSHGDSYLSVLSSRASQRLPKSETTRLVRDDEDLLEGHDDLVEDGGISLGRKAEREARRRRRAEMEKLIQTAEGGGGGRGDKLNTADDDFDPSDDSEAERRAAYEAAQTRAGMDGLSAEREAQRRRAIKSSDSVPRHITPLPDLSVVAAAFREKMALREKEVSEARRHLEDLRRERREVEEREPEVQRLLDEVGERYRALMGAGPAGATDTTTIATATGDCDGDGDIAIEGSTAEGTTPISAAQTLLDRNGTIGAGAGAERGLDSLGATPVREPSVS